MTEKEAKQLLGVKRGQSVDEVKRSYLRLLKTTKPEVDPEGFQRLREAWELWESNHRGPRPRVPVPTSPVLRPAPAPEPSLPPVPLPDSPLPQAAPSAPPTAQELAQRSRSGLTDDERAFLTAALEAGRYLDYELLLAAVNEVIFSYNPYQPAHHAVLRDLISRALPRAGAAPALLVKWSYANQVFETGARLSPEAVEAVRVILLYLEDPESLPQKLYPRLEGLRTHSVSQLYQLPSPTFAAYLDSRPDVRAMRKQSLREAFQGSAGTPSKTSGWWPWIIAAVVIGLLRMLASQGKP